MRCLTRWFVRYSALCLCPLLLSACAWLWPQERSYITLMASPDGSVGQVHITGAKGSQRLQRARDAAPLDGSRAPAPVDEARFQRDFAEALAARPTLPQTFVLYFESGSTVPTTESQGLLAQILDNAAARASADVSIIGHSDTVGSAELNEGLSLHRAQAVADWLTGQGLRVDALSVEAQGKRQLQVVTPDAQSEPRNRRVEVTVR